MCVSDGDFSYIVPPLDGDKRLFYESALNTFILKETEMKVIFYFQQQFVCSQQMH